jgi:hypothetical protein
VRACVCVSVSVCLCLCLCVCVCLWAPTAPADRPPPRRRVGSWTASKMRANYVEILSRIRLNLANVEQFTGTACSLADDNPSIRADIREAAREIHSSALLIDHLRSLFVHQQTVDWRQQLIGGRPAAASARCGWSAAGGDQPPTDNLGYFSYTNKQTLIKAAKSLVANVAKILYLTDEIVLNARHYETGRHGDERECGVPIHLRQQQQHQQHQHHHRQRPIVPYGSSCGQESRAPPSGPDGVCLGERTPMTRHRHQEDAADANLEKVSGL